MLSGVEPQLLSAFVGVLAPVEAARPLLSYYQAATVIAFKSDFVGEHLDFFMAVGADDRLRYGL